MSPFATAKLGLVPRLFVARVIRNTETSSSQLISVVRSLSGSVKHWRDTTMVRRWVGAGMLEAERSFRLVRDCKDMVVLVKAVRAEVASRLDESSSKARHAVRVTSM